MCLVLPKPKPKPVLSAPAGETSGGHSVLYLEAALEGDAESTACQANRKICSLITCGIWLKTSAVWQVQNTGLSSFPPLGTDGTAKVMAIPMHGYPSQDGWQALKGVCGKGVLAEGFSCFLSLSSLCANVRDRLICCRIIQLLQQNERKYRCGHLQVALIMPGF